MALTQALTIGIDIGGTKVAAGVVDPEANILDRVRRDTPTTDPKETEDAIAEIVRDLESRHDVIAVGIGAAGFVDGTRSSVLFAPHLAWRHEPLRDAVERLLACRSSSRTTRTRPPGPSGVSVAARARATWCASPSAPASAARS